MLPDDSVPEAPEAEATPTPETTEPGSPEPALTGPWAQDVSEFFEDDAVRGQVAEFMRTKYQPYVTKLEEEKAGLSAAAELYNELQSSPAQTYLALTEELFGPDAVDPIRGQLIELYGGDEGENEEPADPEKEAELKQQLPPEVREMVEDYQATKRRDSYNQLVDSVVDKYKETDAPVVKELFHPFMSAADGDPEVAYQGYKKWYTDAKQTFGVAPAAEEETETAPPALGSSQATTTTPPTKKQYSNIDEALDDFFAENKAQAPPVVGSV